MVNNILSSFLLGIDKHFTGNRKILCHSLVVTFHMNTQVTYLRDVLLFPDREKYSFVEDLPILLLYYNLMVLPLSLWSHYPTHQIYQSIDPPFSCQHTALHNIPPCQIIHEKISCTFSPYYLQPSFPLLISTAFSIFLTEIL